MLNPITDEIKLRAKSCDTKGFRNSNLIQDCYVLLALSDAGEILYCSENTESVFSLPPADMIGQDFMSLLKNHSAQQLEKLFEQEKINYPSYHDRFLARLELQGQSAIKEAIFYKSGDYICVEIETPQLQAIDISYLDLLFLRLASSINSYNEDSTRLADIVCHAIYKIIGFDRVWYCEFDIEDDNGFVSGEYSNGRMPSLRNHRFPSTDVPNGIRQLYTKVLFRSVYDIEKPTVKVIDQDRNHISGLDLTFSVARELAPSHMKYLKNMDVRSSASFSVIRNNKLVALFGAHAKEPTLLKYRQLAACQHLADLYLKRFDNRKNKERAHFLAQKEREVSVLMNSVINNHFDMRHVVSIDPSMLEKLMVSDIFLCLYNDDIICSQPLEIDLKEKLIELATSLIEDKSIHHTDSLTRIDDRFDSLKHIACGMLAIRIAGNADNVFIWLRSEFAYNEKWKGNPSEAVLLDENGNPGPRKSFESWVRTVTGRSMPWKPYEIETAKRFQREFNTTFYNHYNKMMRIAAEQANAAKSEFLANMSHELRTPLHTIIGFLDSIIQKIDKMPREKQLQYLNLAHTSSERLLWLINDLLDLSKLEAGRMNFSFEKSDLCTVIESCIAEIDPIIRSKTLDVSFKSEPRVIAVFDPERLKQVVINLLSNAAKFTPENKAITISADIKDGSVKLRIADQGVGIPDQELEAIFDKFIQSTKTLTGSGGTGLGLSICKEIINAHRGRIWAENNQDAGASFFIEFPAMLDQQSAA